MLSRKMNGHMLGFFVVVFLGWVSLGWIDPLADKVREGNQLYHDGKYDEALDKYINAQINAPHVPQLDFNVADTQYKRSKYDEAAQLFQKVLKSGDTGVKAESSFNMGNALYRQGKMKEALECYRQAIDFINETEVKSGSKSDALKNDARYNYEYVDRKMKENEQKQRGQDQKNQPQEQDKKEKQEDQQNKGKGEDKEKQESQKDKQKPRPEDTQEKSEDKNDKNQNQSDKEKQKGQQPEQQQPQPQSQDPRQMSKEEAERFLEALNHAEKETRLMKRDTQHLQHRSVDKDW